jgi:sulfur transfer protein SufE
MTNKTLLQQLLAQSHWNDRYRILLDAAKNSESAKSLRTDKNSVSGCSAKTWISHHLQNELHYFQVDSESKIIKGLALLLADIYNGKSTNEIKAIDISAIFQQLQLNKYLSQSRSNGFYALQKSMLQALSC